MTSSEPPRLERRASCRRGCRLGEEGADDTERTTRHSATSSDRPRIFIRLVRRGQVRGQVRRSCARFSRPVVSPRQLVPRLAGAHHIPRADAGGEANSGSSRRARPATPPPPRASPPSSSRRTPDPPRPFKLARISHRPRASPRLGRCEASRAAWRPPRPAAVRPSRPSSPTTTSRASSRRRSACATA